jgi:hypothetical protein
VTPAQAEEHATLVYAYFKKLMDLHMELIPAVDLAARYATTLVCIIFNTPPKEPWDT